MHGFTHMYKINIHRDKENKLVLTRGEGGWVLSERVKGVHVHGMDKSQTTGGKHDAVYTEIHIQ